MSPCHNGSLLTIPSESRLGETNDEEEDEVKLPRSGVENYSCGRGASCHGVDVVKARWWATTTATSPSMPDLQVQNDMGDSKMSVSEKINVFPS